MENLKPEELEKAIKQLAKYNKDFTHYFACLSTANYEISETSRDIKKIVNIDLGKKRSDAGVRHVAQLIKRARFTNKNVYTLLEIEINNLKHIVKYLTDQQPNFEKLANFVFRSELEANSPFTKHNSVSIITNLKKLNNNLNICNNYILPKNEAILQKRKAVQDRLELKLSRLPKTLAYSFDESNKL